MSTSWPFTVHKNERFLKLIPHRCQTNIIEIAEHSNKIKPVVIKEYPIFLEILKTIFLLYITPNDRHIALHQDTLITKGQFINLSFTPAISMPAQTILNALLTQEDDIVYEGAFNALIAVYLGSLHPLEWLFPNTYIVELGRYTHEFDVLCGIKYPQCLIIETTRGFTKEHDNIEESYTWHFKKAIFRKWMLEKLYQVHCQLWYITLQGKFIPDTMPDALPAELEAEQCVIEPTNKLLESVLALEQKYIQVIDLGVFRDTLAFQEIEKLLDVHLLQKMKELL